MLELRRQIAHALFGIVLVFLIYLEFVDFKIIAISIMLTLFIPRLCKFDIINKMTCLLEREFETKNFRARGLFYYLIGVFFTLILFDKNTAIASITILAVGDSLSTIKGFVKHPYNNKKYLEASLIAWLVSGLCASIFVPFYASYIASFVALFIESFQIRIKGHKIDDNLYIPIVAGLVISLITQIL